MQRETALILLGVGFVLILLLVGVALHISSPPSPRPVSEERGSTVVPAAPTSFPPTQTASPVSPPAMVSPSLSPPATQTTAAPTVAALPERTTAPSIVAPLPSIPPLQTQSPTYFPRAKPSSSAISENEAIRWARALLSVYRPKWQVELVKSVDRRLKGESYAVTVEPNQVTVEARTDIGWLYGLLDLAERLQWREPIPAQWIWSPPLPERGLVVENPDWLLKPPRSREALRSLLQKQLRELAWWRFNTLVIKCYGNEPNLSDVLSQLRQMAQGYGVKVVVWAKAISPAIVHWMKQGGQVAVEGALLQNDVIVISTEQEPIAQWLGQGEIAGLKVKLVAPNVPSTVFQFGRSRNRLLMVIGLDEAYKGVFWFDPDWSHQLVRSIRDSNLKGFWLSVSSVPSAWAIAAFAQAVKNPDSNGERLWQQRWAKQGYRGDKWFVFFREASRIIPEILWLGVSPQPQYGASLRSFFIARPIDNIWGFTVLNVTETLKLSRRPDDRATLTADEVARRLEQHVNLVWTLATQLPEPAASDWKVAKRLSLMNSWIGQFYASKIDAALAWGRFEGGDERAGQECLLNLAKSVKAWEQVVAVANTIYPPNNRWAVRLAEWVQELESVKNSVSGSMP